MKVKLNVAISILSKLKYFNTDMYLQIWITDMDVYGRYGYTDMNIYDVSRNHDRLPSTMVPTHTVVMYPHNYLCP